MSVIKYVPTEQFLEFIPKVGHKPIEIVGTIVMTIDSLKSNI